MKIIFSGIMYFRSITVLLGAVMLFSCKNDVQKVNQIAGDTIRPEMTGESLVMIYSDSARIKYKVMTPKYIKMNKVSQPYEEFPEGIHVISYDAEGKESGSIKSKYARKEENTMLWEARNEVVVMNAEGKKLETELLFWDMKNEIIYSDRYVRLTSGGQIVEGNNGFKSDQKLENPVFENITGQVEVEKKSPR